MKIKSKYKEGQYENRFFLTNYILYKNKLQVQFFLSMIRKNTGK